MLYEKAVSKKQQRFFGIVRAAQKGTLEGEASPQVQRAASNMTKSDVKKMASTKHKGLPEKKVVKETSYKESFATNKYKEMAKREADLKRKEDLKVKTKKESVDIDEAKYEKGASNYGKASIRNKRMFGKGGNAAPPEERGAAIQARKTRHQERRHVKKGNKYHEPGKHRPEVYGVNKPEEERKGKNVKEGVKYGLYKGDGKVKFKLNKPEKKKEKELKEYSPNVSYQAKGGKKSGKLSKSSVYSLRGKDESKKDFRKSHTKDIKDGLMKKESIFTPLVFTTERLGGKGYSRKATKGGGDWPDSDRGEGNKATRRAGGKVKAKSPTYIAHVKNKQKVKEEVTSIYEGVLSKFGKKKEKKVEKKPEKAMDAGSRGRRLLQRREYKAKVSEFIPKELEDQYTPNGELVSELDLKKIGSAVWNKTTNILSKLNQKRKDNAASRKKWRDENPGGTISKQTHLNQIRNQGGDTSHWEEVQKEDIADIIARLEKKRISKGGDPEDSPLPAMKKYHADKKKKKVKKEEVVDEGKKKGLWDNIHAKRKRGEKPAKPGDKDYPKTLNVEGLKKARKNVGADTCWDGYKAKGTKKKGGKEVNNCVKAGFEPEGEEIQEGEEINILDTEEWKAAAKKQTSRIMDMWKEGYGKKKKKMGKGY